MKVALSDFVGQHIIVGHASLWVACTQKLAPVYVSQLWLCPPRYIIARLRKTDDTSRVD